MTADVSYSEGADSGCAVMSTFLNYFENQKHHYQCHIYSYFLFLVANLWRLFIMRKKNDIFF